VRFTPTPRARQKAAVAFLNEHAFRTPTWLLDDEVLRRIEPEGALDRIARVQQGLLVRLISDDKIRRLTEMAATAAPGTATYTVPEYLADLRHGLWSEVEGGHASIDAFRRAVQRAYLDVLRDRLNGGPQTSVRVTQGPTGLTLMPVSHATTDGPATIRGELQELDAAVRAAISTAANRETRLHLQDVRVRIERILNPNK
jgi:hypothetical protein